MSLYDRGEATTTERIYHFRCKCGRTGTRRSASRIVKLSCRDCGETVEWWKSDPVTAFVAPDVPEISPEERAELRDDGWRKNTRRAVLLELGPDAPHAATVAEAVPEITFTCPDCKSKRSRKLSDKTSARLCLDCDLITEIAPDVTHDERDDNDGERAQLALAGLDPHTGALH